MPPLPEVARSLARIDSQLVEMELLIERESAALDLLAAEVSLWSVRLQVDHLLKVMSVGLMTLSGERARPERGINLLGRMLMAADWIPRGRARSPKPVVPVERADAELLADTRRLRGAYGDPALALSPFFASPAPVFPHPFFGGLSAAQGVRFIGMHNHHHWKIVRDIRRRAERAAEGAR